MLNHLSRLYNVSMLHSLVTNSRNRIQHKKYANPPLKIKAHPENCSTKGPL